MKVKMNSTNHIAVLIKSIFDIRIKNFSDIINISHLILPPEYKLNIISDKRFTINLKDNDHLAFTTNSTNTDIIYNKAINIDLYFTNDGIFFNVTLNFKDNSFNINYCNSMSTETVLSGTDINRDVIEIIRNSNKALFFIQLFYLIQTLDISILLRSTLVNKINIEGLNDNLIEFERNEYVLEV